jgi:hypothetical protein
MRTTARCVVCTSATPGTARSAPSSASGRALEAGEQVGKARLGVEAVARQRQRVDRRQRGQEAADAAGHHQRDGQRLAPHQAQVAQQLAVQGLHAVTTPAPTATPCARCLARAGCCRRRARSRGRPCAAMAALCVITTAVVPSSRLMRAMASSTSLPVCTSSAPVGSSHSSTSGRLTMARAMATRCCSPPDSCAGKWSRRSLRPTGDGLVDVHRVARDVGHQLHVLAHRQAGDQVVELEHEADVLAPVARQLGLAGAGQPWSPKRTSPAAGHVQPAQDVQQRALAAARRRPAARRTRRAGGSRAPRRCRSAHAPRHAGRACPSPRCRSGADAPAPPPRRTRAAPPRRPRAPRRQCPGPAPRGARRRPDPAPGIEDLG